MEMNDVSVDEVTKRIGLCLCFALDIHDGTSRVATGMNAVMLLKF
jgi:hypothetical protein